MYQPRHPRWRQRLAAAAACLLAAVLPVVLALGIAPPDPGPGHDSLPDFTTYVQTDERKQAFFEYLEPVVAEINGDLRERRQRLDRIRDVLADSDDLLGRDRRWLERLGERYDVSAQDPTERTEALLHRVDVIPVSLALAQAAIESGWGLSRFAREGNNLFGEWCFRDGCGLVPQARAGGARHEVRSFASVAAAMRSYMHNLNSHRAYRGLRDIRARARAAGREPTGLELAEGLDQYSERGQVYVVEVRSLIRSNNLEER